MKPRKPFQFGLAALFGLVTWSAMLVWLLPAISPLDSKALIPAGLLAYLVLVALAWIELARGKP